MKRAMTVPSIADVDPDVVVLHEHLPTADPAGESAAGVEPDGSPNVGVPLAVPSENPADVVVPDVDDAEAGDPPAFEVAPPDYVADYDDDQTYGVEDDGVDQRVPFT